MKVLSSSRILYMCLLILITSIAWYVVKPEVVNAYDVSLYGAGNCHCAKLALCPTGLGCDSGQYIKYCATSYPPIESCMKNTLNKPCGTDSGCGVYIGGSFNCEVTS